MQHHIFLLSILQFVIVEFIGIVRLMAPKQLVENTRSAENAVSSRDEAATSLTAVPALPLTEMTEEPPIEAEYVVIEEVVQVGNGVSLAVANECFDPWNPNVSLDTLAKEYAKLSEEEKYAKLSVVSQAHREAQDEMKKRMSVMKPDELTPEDVKPSAETTTKKTHERFDGKTLTFNVMLNGVSHVIVIKSNERVGTLRQMVCRQGGLNNRTRLAFNREGGFKCADYSAGTYLYTSGLQNNDAIVTLQLPSEAAPKAEPKPAPKASPSSSVQRDTDGNSIAYAFFTPCAWRAWGRERRGRACDWWGGLQERWCWEFVQGWADSQKSLNHHTCFDVFSQPHICWLLLKTSNNELLDGFKVAELSLTTVG